MRHGPAEQPLVIGAVEIDVALERVMARPAVHAVFEPVEGENAGEDEIVVARFPGPGLAGRLARGEHAARVRRLRRCGDARDAIPAACDKNFACRRSLPAPSTPAMRRAPRPPSSRIARWRSTSTTRRREGSSEGAPRRASAARARSRARAARLGSTGRVMGSALCRKASPSDRVNFPIRGAP